MGEVEEEEVCLDYYTGTRYRRLVFTWQDDSAQEQHTQQRWAGNRPCLPGSLAAIHHIYNNFGRRQASTAQVRM